MSGIDPALALYAQYGYISPTSITTAAQLAAFQATVPATAIPATAAIYELRVFFQKLPWASQSAAQNVQAGVVAGVNAQIASFGYGGIAASQYGLNWAQNYYWFRFKETGTIAITAPMLITIAEIIIVALVAAGLIYVAIQWIKVTQTQATTQAQATATKTDLATKVTDAYTSGQMTADQYAAAMKAINETVTVPTVPSVGIGWPTLTELEPIIILVAIVAAAALGVSWFRK